MRRKIPGKIKRTCKICAIEFMARHDRKGLFCSHSCASKIGKCKSKKIFKNCQQCNKPYLIQRYRKDISLYCSIECRRKNMPKKHEHPLWKGGIGRSWASKVLIKRLIKLVGKCQQCESIENLQGHHVIPYSENKSLQADENNIQILCKVCHASKHPSLARFILKGLMHD